MTKLSKLLHGEMGGPYSAIESLGLHPKRESGRLVFWYTFLFREVKISSKKAIFS